MVAQEIQRFRSVKIGVVARVTVAAKRFAGDLCTRIDRVVARKSSSESLKLITGTDERSCNV